MEGLIFGILRYLRNFNKTKYTWKSRELQRHTRQCIQGQIVGARESLNGREKISAPIAYYRKIPRLSPRLI